MNLKEKELLNELMKSKKESSHLGRKFEFEEKSSEGFFSLFQ